MYLLLTTQENSSSAGCPARVPVLSTNDVFTEDPKEG